MTSGDTVRLNGTEGVVEKLLWLNTATDTTTSVYSETLWLTYATDVLVFCNWAKSRFNHSFRANLAGA